MKMKLTTILLTTFAITYAINATAQHQEQKEKSPVEIAYEQTEMLRESLNLTHYQVFKVDSILQSNIAGVVNQFEEMKKSGLQNPDSYREVQKRWQTKTDSEFEKLFTLEQFERYLKLSGMPSKERKKKMAELRKKAKENEKK